MLALDACQFYNLPPVVRRWVGRGVLKYISIGGQNTVAVTNDDVLRYVISRLC